MSEALGDLHDKPGHLIRRCQQIAVALFLEECAEFDLTPMQYALLRATEAMPGQDQITLAGLIGIDRSNAARLCATLEKRGLVQRAQDAKDRRSRCLYPTLEGHALLRLAEPAVARVQDALLAPLAPAERAAFLTALHRIVEAHNDTSRAPLKRTRDAA